MSWLRNAEGKHGLKISYHVPARPSGDTRWPKHGRRILAGLKPFVGKGPRRFQSWCNTRLHTPIIKTVQGNDRRRLARERSVRRSVRGCSISMRDASSQPRRLSWPLKMWLSPIERRGFAATQVKILSSTSHVRSCTRQLLMLDSHNVYGKRLADI